MINSIKDLKNIDDPIITQAVDVVERAKTAVTAGQITEEQYNEIISDALEVHEMVDSMSDVSRKVKIREAIKFLANFSILTKLL